MKIAIIGRSEALYDTVEYLHAAGFNIACILTAKEAPEYRRTANDFEALADKMNIPFATGPNITDHYDFLKNVGADIAISINYTGIIPEAIICLFPHGILNAHGGDLPRYRGNACQAWAILNGESKIGLCIHKMIGGELDSGDIIARDYLEIDEATTITKVWEWLNNRIPELCLEAIKNLSTDASYVLQRQSKNPVDALRCYPRKPEDGQIDWNQSALHILRLVNASNKPYSGAFCNFEGDPFIIWSAEIVTVNENFNAVPGQITKIGADNREVACSGSKLKILLAEYGGTVGVPSIWIKSVRKRFS